MDSNQRHAQPMDPFHRARNQAHEAMDETVAFSEKQPSRVGFHRAQPSSEELPQHTRFVSKEEFDLRVEVLRSGIEEKLDPDLMHPLESIGEYHARTALGESARLDRLAYAASEKQRQGSHSGARSAYVAWVRAREAQSSEAALYDPIAILGRRWAGEAA